MCMQAPAENAVCTLPISLKKEANYHHRHHHYYYYYYYRSQLYRPWCLLRTVLISREQLSRQLG